ncbi:hypothetical protein PROFUN_11762 [Planoprotostelium fungivorum]|uniref:Uncharacterized protein n=1 Tax=Planoprotostelium fungivorum TaxID=1890364 RepID=A0A2P6N8L0_9EUKA|nr:hypothetical protein PROFUN_11762 [Planoprotostelium fungivorum]
MTQWSNSVYNDIIIQLSQSFVDYLKHKIQNTEIRGKKLKDLRRGYKNCWKREKGYATEIKKVQVECTSKTMSLEPQLKEMHKTLEQRD